MPFSAILAAKLAEINVFPSQEFDTNLLTSEEFNAIIFDVTINYWDRDLELVRKVRNNKDIKIPILILSSEFLQEKILQFRKAGADEFLVKPFAKVDLINSINKITAV